MASNSFDPLALVDLLWAPSTRVGRSGATIGGIVDAGLAMADEEGLAALSMRALADRVGIAPMTLYGFVPGRAQLLELMFDRVIGTTYAQPPAVAGDWRAGARRMAREIFEHHLEHRWLAEMLPSRPVLGPGVCRTYENELAIFAGIGLTEVEMDHAVSHVRGLAQHAARWQIGLDRARTVSGLSDQQWWDRIGPSLMKAMASEELPLARRVGETVRSAGEPWATVEAGMDWLLDGLTTRIK